MYRCSSFLLDSLGKQVLPKHISLFENPHLKAMTGSAPDLILVNGNIRTMDPLTPRVEALADAGLTKDDIDGYFCAGDAPGLGPLSMVDYMNLKVRHVDSTDTGGSVRGPSSAGSG